MSVILLIEDDKSIRELLRSTLEEQGYEVLAAEDGPNGLAIALQSVPHLILLDLVLPGLDGFEVCRRLRASLKTSHIPIIMLTARSSMLDKLAGLDLGADDYVTKPFDTDELLARVRAQLRRVQRSLLSPLTGLPGNAQVEEAVRELVKIQDKTWAVLYLDIDHFKEYNDVYGFLQGNELIKATARIIQETVSAMGSGEPFEMVGHIGGDDFVVLTSEEGAERLCRELLRRFDAMVPEYYDERDRQRGYVVTADRQGRVIKAPIATLSIGVVTNRFRRIDNHWLVGSLAAEVKKKAKALPGSSYYVDQRK